MTRIYLASSWRNPDQPAAVRALRSQGYEVYDFRNPDADWTDPQLGDDSGGFQWSTIDPRWETWSPWAFKQALNTPAAAAGYANDWDAMERADLGILLLPCGRSAHLEAGYFAGHPNKSLFIVCPALDEPELMYLMADGIYLSMDELLEGGVQ